MNFFLAFIGGYIYFAGQAEYRQVVLEHQANHFSGFREGNVEVDVSPPPYAAGKSPNGGPLLERLRRLFHR